jgi:uncharacterized protein YcbK (DUF882 family)
MNKGIEPWLTRDFTCREFMCHCCGACRMQAQFMYALQTLRDLAGEPIHVISGYRCRRHNINIGGAEFSYHMKGMAADIIIAKHSISETVSLAHKVDAFKHGGIGQYRSWVHVDIGPARRWR